MAWVFITGFTFLSCASVKARGEFGSPSDMIGNYAYLSTDKVGVGGRIQIWSVDGFLTSIPINETEQLLIPAGEHTIKVQYWNDEPNKLFLDLVTSREPIAIYFDFRPGEYYTVDSHDDGESFVIEKAKDEKGSLKKVIDRSSVPGQSIWSYNTLDTTKQTKLEGTWILVDITTKDGKSMIGNADNAPVSFVFKGNYFEFKNEGALAMWKPNLIILFYKAGYFEIKDNQFFLNIFSDYNMATHKGLLKVENVGWFVQNDVIEDRNTEKYTYILDGDTLKLTGGFIGSIAVFKKQ
jgi:hypothetical protein